jgi:hypothetical protein
MAVAVVDPRGHATMRYVKIQRDLGSTVEIASGLVPADRVINNPPDSLSEGQLVRVSGASGVSARSGKGIPGRQG